MTLSPRCACGPWLHYIDPAVQTLIVQCVRALGPTVVVRGPAGAWRVPRHYLALHGRPTPAALPRLAARYRWAPVTDTKEKSDADHVE
jgi:hypothetical protein